jgi:hypothetical protein
MAGLAEEIERCRDSVRDRARERDQALTAPLCSSPNSCTCSDDNAQWSKLRTLGVAILGSPTNSARD